MTLFYYICTYILIVMCVVVSHFFLSLHLKSYDSKIEKKKKYWEHIRKRCEKKKSYKLKRSEVRKLNRAQMLAAFYEVYKESSVTEFQQLLLTNKDRIISNSKRHKSKTIRAYFAYGLSAFQMNDSELSEGFDALMLEYILDDSVYTRENALKALYSFGKPEKVAIAFIRLTYMNINHSTKLIADGLLMFNGNHRELSRVLMEQFRNFAECYQSSILSYLYYQDEHQYDTKLITYLFDVNTSQDIKCNVLRIISKVKNLESKQAILSVLKQCNDENGWESAAVAASMAGTYHGDEQISQALREALTSRYWHVRMNSAKSLVRLGLSEEDRQKIIEGKDEYAKNALTYAMRMTV